MDNYFAKIKSKKFRKSGTYSRLLQKYRKKWNLTKNTAQMEPLIQNLQVVVPDIPPIEVPADTVSLPASDPEPTTDTDVVSDAINVDELIYKNSEHPNLSDGLRSWASEFHITQAALTALLGVLNANLTVGLPKDARTIMKTPRKLDITQMEDNGLYWHQGVENCMRKALSKTDRPLSLTLNLNIDGLPITKSSIKSFWPILCNFHELLKIPPMSVGVYYGTSKPKSVHEFLNPFIDELLPILEKGLVINGFQVTIKIRCFVCDSPARSFTKGVKNFNGLYGCLKCTTKGKYNHTAGTVVYPQVDAPLRTDEKFRNKEYHDHQRSDTPLTRLPIDMVEDVIVADSLHLLELGVMRRLLNGWRTGSIV